MGIGSCCFNSEVGLLLSHNRLLDTEKQSIETVAKRHFGLVVGGCDCKGQLPHLPSLLDSAASVDFAGSICHHD